MSLKPLTNILEDCLNVEVFSTLHLMFFSHISHQTSSLNLVFFLHKQNRRKLGPLVPKPAFSGPPDVPLLEQENKLPQFLELCHFSCFFVGQRLFMFFTVQNSIEIFSCASFQAYCASIFLHLHITDKMKCVNTAFAFIVRM